MFVWPPEWGGLGEEGRVEEEEEDSEMEGLEEDREEGNGAERE